MPGDVRPGGRFYEPDIPPAAHSFFYLLRDSLLLRKRLVPRINIPSGILNRIDIFLPYFSSPLQPNISSLSYETPKSHGFYLLVSSAVLRHMSSFLSRTPVPPGVSVF